jgi:hypothetical protein
MSGEASGSRTGANERLRVALLRLLRGIDMPYWFHSDG